MLDNRLKDSPTKRLPTKGQENDAFMQDDNEADFFDDYNEYDENDNERTGTRPTGRDAYRTRREPYRTDRRQRSAKSSRPRNHRSTSGKMKAKSAFTAAYIAMLVVAVAVCIVLFVLAFQWVIESGPRLDIPNNPFYTNGENATEPLGRPEIRNFTALITNISTNPRELTLFDISDDDWRILPLPEDADINNRSNIPISFTQLRVGQLVEISYDARRDEIAVVRESVRAREFSDRTNVHVNLENRTISVGHEVFDFNNNTLVLSQTGEPLDISSIGRDDSINIISYGTTAWLIQLYASHGFLEIVGGDLIQDGTITIGNMFPFPLDEISGALSVTEGLHRIVVEGRNIDTFIDNISIEPGRTLPLNLSNVGIRMSTLYISVTPPDAAIFINGVMLGESGPTVLPFGPHIIRVEHDGYETYEMEVDLVDPVETVQIELIEIPQYGSIMLFTQPANAEIFINNELVGRSPFSQELPPGTHTVTARLPGWADYTIFVNIEPRQDYIRTMHLVVATMPPETQPTTAPPTAETTEAARPPLISLPPLPTQ